MSRFFFVLALGVFLAGSFRKKERKSAKQVTPEK